MSMRSQHCTRSDKKRTSRFLAGLKRSVEASPSTPICILARKRGMDATTLRRVVKEDLGYTSYMYSKRHILNNKRKAIRLERSKVLLNDHTHNERHLIFFSDEKLLNVDAGKNPQNDRFLAADKSNVPYLVCLPVKEPCLHHDPWGHLQQGPHLGSPLFPSRTEGQHGCLHMCSGWLSTRQRSPGPP